MLAIHKENKFCYGYASKEQVEFDEIEESYLPENFDNFLDSDGNPKYKFENDVLVEIDFKVTNEYKSAKNQQIDSETYQLIKKWCRDHGKCEEYYLRQARTSTDFKAYNAEVDKIINAQKTKKNQIGK